MVLPGVGRVFFRSSVLRFVSPGGAQRAMLDVDVVRRRTFMEYRMLRWLTSGCLLFLAAAALATEKDGEDDVFSMNIEQLLSVDIYSVSKSPKTLVDSPAAVYVLTPEDIRRSGATSLPELFRFVPGMNVARSESGRWQVSARGFNQAFSTKLLVLLDGRTVYNPLMSGVYWDVQDVLMEDLERIEVIRGPGGSLWGANAVNGVINVSTKSAKETQGVLVSTAAGNEDRLLTSARFGGQLGDTWYRVFAQHAERDGGWMNGRASFDDSTLTHGGFRIDSDLARLDRLTLQGDVYEGSKDSPFEALTLLPPYKSLAINSADLMGMNVLGRLTHESRGGGEFALQLYVDRTERLQSLLMDERRTTYDVDLQQRVRPLGRHVLMFGMEYRLSADETGVGYSMNFQPKKKTDDLVSTFVQDDIGLCDDRVHLILGAKVEENGYTGVEYQPSGRLSWEISKDQSVWVAVARAVRIPSRFDADAEVGVTVMPPRSVGGLPTLVEYSGSDDLDSESLTAYEAGYRVQPTANLFADLVGFVNQYDDLLLSTPMPPTLAGDPVPHVVLPLLRGNKGGGEVRGGELSVDWWPLTCWRVSASYSVLEMDVRDERSNGESPECQQAFRSLYNLTRSLELDAAIYHVEAVKYQEIPEYWRTDLRLGWRYSDRLSFSVVGQNVLDERHPEFHPYGAPYPVEIERSVYGKFTWEM